MTDELPLLSRPRSWDAFYSEPRIAEFRRRAYLEAFGNEYPLDEATDGYVTRTELRVLASALVVGPGDQIVDLGCGRGGPGLWVARTTGAGLVGIDVSQPALDKARASARQLGFANTISYKLARFDATGLGTASIDGAISIDVIWAIPDKQAGFSEVARILKPGARFVFTDWERDLSPPGYPAPINDYRQLLEAAGFELEFRQLNPEADAKRRVFYEKMLHYQAELLEVLEHKAAESTLREARGWLGQLDGVDYMNYSRRVLIAARRLAGA
jgi:ubiquinone/menaquinone biosynthesis C-methylase UbiE